MSAENLFDPDISNRVDRPIRIGASLPTTCRRGEMFFLVGSTNKIYASFSTNTWTEIASASGSGGVVGSVFGRTGAVTGAAADYAAVVVSALDVSLSARPSCLATNSAVQSIPDTTATLLTFDTDTFDVGGCHDLVTNTDRLTVPAGGGGTYLCIAQCVIAASALGRRSIQLRKNDTAFTTGKQLLGDASITSCVTAVGLVQLAATDYVNATMQQVSGGALNTVAGASNTFISFTKLF